jgi:hypothetical protein
VQARTPFQLSADGTMVYDTANNVSWLANANSPATNRFGLKIPFSVRRVWVQVPPRAPSRINQESGF